jgi:hypothetical protein
LVRSWVESKCERRMTEGAYELNLINKNPTHIYLGIEKFYIITLHRIGIVSSCYLLPDLCKPFILFNLLLTLSICLSLCLLVSLLRS